MLFAFLTLLVFAAGVGQFIMSVHLPHPWHRRGGDGPPQHRGHRPHVSSDEPSRVTSQVPHRVHFPNRPPKHLLASSRGQHRQKREQGGTTTPQTNTDSRNVAETPTQAELMHPPSLRTSQHDVTLASSMTVRRGKLCRALHAFYYPWYGTPDVDGAWAHWDHPRMPHWTQEVTDQFPKARHKPPCDIGSAYYPFLGPYSSANRTVVCQHAAWMAEAGIGVMVVSWFPPKQHEGNGRELDKLFPLILDCAFQHDLRVAVHSEPYEGRDAKAVKRDIQYIHETYGVHPGLYRAGPFALPVVYVYDPYSVPAERWAETFRSSSVPSSIGSGDGTIRGTAFDAIAIALFLQGAEDTSKYLDVAGFDGGYNYFASDTFTFASGHPHWSGLVRGAASRKARRRGIVSSGRSSSVALLPRSGDDQRGEFHDATVARFFVPCAGPGYEDRPVRPWNEENSKDRQFGQFYRDALHAAALAFPERHDGRRLEEQAPDGSGGDQRPAAPSSIATWSPSFVAITSWNEWHEGTQIEPAASNPPDRRSSESDLFPYLTYDSASSRGGGRTHHAKPAAADPMMYVAITRRFVEEFC